MANVLVKVGTDFVSNNTAICFSSGTDHISIECGNHPVTMPYKGNELNVSDIARLIRFFLNSLEIDNHEKSDVERSHECDPSGLKEEV